VPEGTTRLILASQFKGYRNTMSELTDRLRAFSILMALVLTGSALTGCSRGLYRRQADRESHYLIREKSLGTPWAVPDAFTIDPDPRSRFFDPADPDCPRLPPAGPQLYQYKLPELSHRGGRPVESLPAPLETQPADAPELPVPQDVLQTDGASAGNGPRQAGQGPLRLVAFAEDPAPAGPASAVSDQAADPFLDDITSATDPRAGTKELKFQPVGRAYWNDVPDQCVARMLDFPSVREEYRMSFGAPPPPTLLSTAPRMTVHDLFELAVLNSREYQREKEALYQAALNLSLERYAYATKFTARGNGVDTAYTHHRVDGTTVNTLTVPSAVSGEKLLASGGTLLGRFANDVVLTFNGPTGFAADISSEMLFEITQSVFQRDVVLEPLIQSERDLVYAARRYARYRREFFFDVARTYYSILLTCRGIEIDAQNYFAQVRNYEQAREEVGSEISAAPNVIALNQYEQGVLSARSSLIRQCLQLEDELDRMKLTFGLPTETPIDVDLTELEQLTLRDMIEVNRAQAHRWQVRLRTLRAKDPEDNHGDILTADYSMAERLITWFMQRRRVDPTIDEPVDLYRHRARFRLDAARLDVLDERKNLQEVLTADPPKQRILVFQRQIDMITSLATVVQRQGQLGTRLDLPDGTLDAARVEYSAQLEEFKKLQQGLSDALENNADDTVIVDLIEGATQVLATLDRLSQELDVLIFGHPVESVSLQETLERTDVLMATAQAAFDAAGQGLPPVDISVDDAMLTALVQRLDLMNERGALADRWREVKIAADELRSRLDLNASQTIGTAKNRPFDFSTDNATTRLRLAWDLPLNRKSNRNLYRRTLINYHAGLRNLQQYEDTIKQQVRSQLRNLEQRRVQYPISVAQAALAEEQVLSTRLQLILGLPGVRAPDLLDAYNASRVALGAMVDLRIGYIVERAQFALEMEAMMLDDTGFWPDMDNPQYQPRPDFVYPWNAGSAYGDFPAFLRVSRELRGMLNYAPPGASPGPQPDAGAASAEPDEADEANDVDDAGQADELGWAFPPPAPVVEPAADRR